MAVQTSSPDFRCMQIAEMSLERMAVIETVVEAGKSMVRDIKIEVFEEMAPLESEWRGLEADSYNSLHQGYDWCAAWMKTHNNPLAIIRGSHNGKTCFILPLEIPRSKWVRTAQYISTHFNNINNGLFSADFRASCNEAEAHEIARRLKVILRGRAVLISLQNIPFDWRGETHPLSRLPSVENQNHAFQLPLFRDFEATIGQLNAKRRRKNFRNQCRKIDAHGGFTHIVAETAADKSELIDLFFAQKAARFEAHGLPDVFRPPEIQAFFRELLKVEGQGFDCPLQLHAIRLKGDHEGRIAAIAGLSRKGDHVICQFGSIDDSLIPDASPGELLFWLMIEKCCAQGAAIFDFGLGDQGYKRHWCTVETVQHDILLAVTPFGHLAAIAQYGLTRTKAAIKRYPWLYDFIQRIRAQGGNTPEKSAQADD